VGQPLVAQAAHAAREEADPPTFPLLARFVEDLHPDADREGGQPGLELRLELRAERRDLLGDLAEGADAGQHQGLRAQDLRRLRLHRHRGPRALEALLDAVDVSDAVVQEREG